MRYLGNNYTAAHRRVGRTVDTLRHYNVSEDLIQHYIRVMTVGCPNKMVFETSRHNAMKYWRGGNNPSIKRKLDQVMNTMNKEERNNFVIALPAWLWRFTPHLFYTPQHILEKEGKKDRQIFDAKYRHDADAIPVNMMTTTQEGTELDCAFGDVLLRLLTRVWNLRISYPSQDLILHANDVKSCFRQLKHHPDVMGAFSYILGPYLFLQCSLTFGSDFSPASWEAVRRIAEHLAEALFEDKTLRSKHRTYLDRLIWKKDLGSKKARFTQAKRDNINKGVFDDNGIPANTPHDFYVDDDVYSELFDIDRVEQAVAASIEAIFILLGDSDLSLHQDAVSFDKLEETMINYNNRILGRAINTRLMTVSIPIDYTRSTVQLLQKRWHNRRQSYFIQDIETLTGRLGHISETVPWLRFLLAHVYSSVAHALTVSKSHLISTRKEFRDLLKFLKTPRPLTAGKDGTPLMTEDTHKRHTSFALSVTAKAVHKARLPIHINKTLREELRLITTALSADWINMQRPIGHMVKRVPSGTGYSDSCLSAAGGFSIDMTFWWYIEWPEAIQKRTLRFIKNNKNNQLISINVLEYAALILNFIASTHYFRTYHNDVTDPFPTSLLYADNSTCEAWGKLKQCKTSMIGRNLGRLQCALMINNHVGINIDHVTTTQNEIADRISRIKHETNALPEFHKLLQDFPQLKSCRRFHPSPELVSSITAVLLREKSFDPLAAANKILDGLGKSTTSASADSWN